jgi:hypothetical protein
MNIADIIKEAQNDPELFSKIDTAKLLESLESVKNDFLENQTIDTISTNVFDSLVQLGVDKDILKTHCEKLVGYRYVDELHLLHKGKYVRWIRHDMPDKLVKGAVVVDIQFGDFGANILCRLVTGDFLKYRFDKCNTYQKLTDEEQLILTIYEQSA